MDAGLMRSFLKQTSVLLAPRSALSTFGATDIQYYLISSVEDLKNKTRLREGRVVSERPKILTADAFKDRFEGFGDDAAEFEKWLSGSYKDLLRALEYNFKNQGFTTRVLSEPPPQVADRIMKEAAERDSRNQAVIQCPDGGWSLALMKFSLDEAARSFPTNVRDLDRRGLFGKP
jgi:hypothetical protein